MTTIYSFTGGSDGANPNAPVAVGAGGVLYGTTYNAAGPVGGYGTVFSLTPPASPGGAWTKAVLYSFNGDTSTVWFESRLIIGSGGILYGAAASSAPSGSGDLGSIFSLTPPVTPGGPWTEQTLLNFTGLGGSGYSPNGLVLGAGGVLFGTTRYGGGASCGTVFALKPPTSPGGPWSTATLYRFQGGADGCEPLPGVALAKDTAGLPVLYGMTGGQGGLNGGTIYALTAPASPGGAWTEQVLMSNPPSSSGYSAENNLAVGGGGVLYGAMTGGGSLGGGAVFSLTPPVPPSSTWTQQLLYNFPSLGDHFATPGVMAMGKSGTLYGTTQFGGSSFAGNAYVLKPPASPGGAWTLLLLHTFSGIDGMNPTGVTIGSGGILYGATQAGGAFGYGTLFQLTE